MSTSLKSLSAVLLSIGLAVSVNAGTTGSVGLLTPQASGAGTPDGDYVSDANGLNTSYHFWIEVPPSLSTLNVDIFDPDIGLGGANEDTSGRDRNRANNYASAANYTLFDPSGNQRNTLFNTGNLTTPTTSDNTWKSFYSGADTVADNFGTAAYNNQDGTVPWTTNWDETNDDDNAGAGQILITGGQLRIRDNGGAASTIERQADLSDFSSATLNFTVSYGGTPIGTDSIALQMSSNGGTSWTTVQTYSGVTLSGAQSFDITAYRATNTRVRFIRTNGYNSTSKTFFVDALSIALGGVMAGHWEVRVNMNSTITNGTDINALGIRANDGTSGAGGTELPIYSDAMTPLGVNPPNSGTISRSYAFYPYITSGCSCNHNDFDYDSNSGTVGSLTYSSRTGTFTKSIASAALSANDVWARNNITGWTTDTTSKDYGIWSLAATIQSYLVGGNPNGNYTVIYDGNYVLGTASCTNCTAPTANPPANTFRLYFGNDTGTAPVKPYLEQELTERGNAVLAVGVPQRYTVTVRIANPTARPIVFSATNLITSNVPGGRAVYGGNAAVGQGSIVSQPAVGGSGNITWNPGTLAAGGLSIMSYDVTVTATAAGQRTVVTGTTASNGTTAKYLDETGNTTQTRATYTFGPICELAVTQGLATEALVSSFDAAVRGSKTVVEWKTSSEAGTIGYNLYRSGGKTLTKVNRSLLLANVSAPQGGKYRFIDGGSTDARPSYVLEELTASGKKIQYGPFFPNGKTVSPDPVTTDYAKAPATHASWASVKVPPVRFKKTKISAAVAGVSTTGIVRVAASDIASTLGVDASLIQNAIRTGGLTVTNSGATVNWGGTPDGSTLYFYGQKGDTIYSTERAYRIALGAGSTIPYVPASASSAPMTVFNGSRDSEVDAFYATVVPIDPDSDYWYWDFIVSGDPTDGMKQFPVQAPSLNSTDGATLEVRLQGAIKDGTHHAKITLNSVPIGDVTFSSFDGRAQTLVVPAALLHEGANQVGVQGVLENGAAMDVFYVDGFKLSYQRAAHPEGGRLELPVAGSTAITAGPFVAGSVAVDITSPLRPSFLQAAVNGSGNFSFTTPATARTLFFSEPGSFVAPSSLRAVGAPALRSTLNRADYVVITDPALHDSAASLAHTRDKDGLLTYVADLDQIYDEFSGGNRTPKAIRDFITFTASWQKAPMYFVLAGAGSADYRGILDDPGLIPPLMISTSNGLFASDSLFADRNGDGLPDVAIGRIPVTSAAELDAYSAKVLANMKRSVAQSPVVFTADATDRGLDFKPYSAQSEASFTTRPLTRIYADQVGNDAARAALLASFQTGSSLISWVGHGGLDRLSNASLLTTADVPSLTTSGPVPIFVAMTCAINRFELGPLDALGAALTRSPNGGAMAVWSASGLSLPADANGLERTFMQLAAATPGARVGDLVVKSLAANPAAGETGSVYLLLGDPSLKVQLPNEAIPTGTVSHTVE